MLKINSTVNQDIFNFDSDKFYKDMNVAFYKNTDDFLHFKKKIKEIEEKILTNKTFPNIHNPLLKVIESNERKSIFFRIKKSNDTFIGREFLISSTIKINEKTNTLYKIYRTLQNNNYIEELKCIFKTEIYYHLSARKVALDTNDFIVPELRNFFIHKDQAGYIYFVLEMEFVDMIPISKILNPSNAQILYNKIKKTLSDLNEANIFHNDLKIDNIQVSKEDNSKIVLIDFGVASNQFTNTNSKGMPYFFFDRLFSENTEEVDYKAFVQWATENGRFKLLHDEVEHTVKVNKRSPNRSSPNRTQSKSNRSRSSPNRSRNSRRSQGSSTRSPSRRRSSPNRSKSNRSQNSPNQTQNKRRSSSQGRSNSDKNKKINSNNYHI